MGIAEMVAVVMAIVEFVKKSFPKLKIEGPIAIVLVALSCVGVVAYDFINQGKAFDIAQALLLVVQVFIGANAGYNLIKVARPKPD